MSDFSAARAPRGADKAAVTAEKRPFFKKLLDLVVPSPGSRDQLIESLAVAENKELIEPESRMMLEGVIRMADMTAGDVMVASRHMDLLDIDAPFDEMLHVIIHTGHSRFPVFEERRDNVIGILMAKDLLKRGGFKAVEAFGSSGRTAQECVVPADFLLSVGFRTLRPHVTTPRMRMDLRSMLTWRAELEAAWDRLLSPVRHPASPPTARDGAHREQPAPGDS